MYTMCTTQPQVQVHTSVCRKWMPTSIFCHGKSYTEICNHNLIIRKLENVYSWCSSFGKLLLLLLTLLPLRWCRFIKLSYCNSNIYVCSHYILQSWISGDIRVTQQVLCVQDLVRHLSLQLLMYPETIEKWHVFCMKRIP